MTDSVYDASRLNAAIDRLSHDKLVSITKLICEKNSVTRELFLDSLFVNESEIPSSGAAHTPGASSTDNNENEREITSSAKTVNLRRSRELEKYDLCVNFKKDFDVTENTPKSCSYHPEESHEDEELDLYNQNFRTASEEENKKEFPEASIHPCCNRHGDEEPCTTGWHQGSNFEAAKRRIADRGANNSAN